MCAPQLPGLSASNARRELLLPLPGLPRTATTPPAGMRNDAAASSSPAFRGHPYVSRGFPVGCPSRPLGRGSWPGWAWLFYRIRRPVPPRCHLHHADFSGRGSAGMAQRGTRISRPLPKTPGPGTIELADSRTAVGHRAEGNSPPGTAGIDAFAATWHGPPRWNRPENRNDWERRRSTGQ